MAATSLIRTTSSSIDEVLVKIMTETSAKYLQALRKLFEAKGVRADEYAIGKAAPEATCLEYYDDQWHLYTLDHNVKCHEQCFADVSDGCIAMIRDFAGSDDEEARWVAEYQRAIASDPRQGISAGRLRAVLQQWAKSVAVL